MEAECHITRGPRQRLGITVKPYDRNLTVTSVDGEGPATTTKVFFRPTIFGIGLQVNDEIIRVSNTRDPHHMIKEVRTADVLHLLIHRPQPPPPDTPPPPGSKLNTILEEAEEENDDPYVTISVLCEHADSPKAGPKARPRRLCKGTPRLPEWWDLVADNAE